MLRLGRVERTAQDGSLAPQAGARGSVLGDPARDAFGHTRFILWRSPGFVRLEAELAEVQRECANGHRPCGYIPVQGLLAGVESGDTFHMSVLALTTSLFNAYDTAAAEAAQAAREAARAKSKAALSEVKPVDASGRGTARGWNAPKESPRPAPASAGSANLQLLRRAMDNHTIDISA